MKKHNLFWIIPLSFLLGMLYGTLFVFPNQINLTMDIGENYIKVVDTFNKTIDNSLMFCKNETNWYRENLVYMWKELQECRDIQMEFYREGEECFKRLKK